MAAERKRGGDSSNKEANNGASGCQTQGVERKILNRRPSISIGKEKVIGRLSFTRAAGVRPPPRIEREPRMARYVRILRGGAADRSAASRSILTNWIFPPSFSSFQGDLDY